jgi:uncharacterized circularly permuted ATP-grasp superfamily protein/uncharacterized alpha-E superfamily protein
MTTNAQAAQVPLADVVAGYAPRPGTHDEMIDGSGAVRDHWKPVLAALSGFDPRERWARAARLNRRVRETGIAHDIFADPSKPVQPWRVDLLPLLVSAQEWAWLERALVQRARLMNAILADVYGPQHLLEQGRIPPGLVFADPSYVRAAKNCRPNDGYVQFFASDLARGPDGTWRVIDTHTETPAGIGLVLANRVVHTQVAGELFAASNADRLAPFFREMQSALAQRCGRADPRIAILTPGPKHDDYFSHAYLARYLGTLLVEGSDLRVVGDEVMLKTLEGLQPIDLVIRCIEGAASDPLELDPSGFLGPVGLMQAYRTHPDMVVNSIGSAVVENRGLGRYLPEICKTLLGEALLLQDAPRWWLGEAHSSAHALANLDALVIRPAHEGTARPGHASLGTVTRSLSDRQRLDLIETIRLRGDTLVAEEKVGFGTLPAWTPDGLMPRPFAVRLFASSTRDGFHVMPGGLAMTVDPDNAVGLNSPEGETRDVWVLSDGVKAPHVSLWRPTVDTAHVQRSQRVLQSRVADNLFWLGRYAERADWTLRMLRCAVVRQQSDSGDAPSHRAAAVCLETLLAKDDKSARLPSAAGNAVGIDALVRLLMSARGGTHSLVNACDSLHQIASLTRDRLSLEAWRTLNALGPCSTWRDRLGTTPTVEIIDRLDEGLLVIAAFNGLMHENMTRNSGWAFLDMGRRLERGSLLCEAIGPLFEKKNSADDEFHRLMFLLEAADSFITYRSRYRLDPMLPLVLDLLLIDETNPRSLAFQLSQLSKHLEGLPRRTSGAGLPEERRILLALLSAVRLADVQALSRANERSQRPQLAAALTEQSQRLPELSSAIMRRYFNLKEEQPHRVRTQSNVAP